MAGNGKWPTLIEVDLDERSWLLEDGVASIVVPYGKSLDDRARGRQERVSSTAGVCWVLSNLGSDTFFATASVAGKPRYASQILEKQLRDEGVLEEPGNVIIHGRCKTRGDVFYTALTIKQWMHYQQQEQDASDHRMIVPVAAALYRQILQVKSGITAVIFQHGCSFDVLVGNRQFLIGAEQIRAFSHLAMDMDGAISNLVLALQTLSTEEHIEIDEVRWFCWREEDLDSDENALSDDALALNLQAQLDVPVEVMPQDIARIDHDRVFRSSVQALMSPLGNSDCVNGGLGKTLFAAEKTLPMAAASLLALGLALVVLCWQWMGEVTVLQQEIETIQQTINNDWQKQANALLVDGARYDASKKVKEVLAFIEEMKATVDVPDLRSLLLDVQHASAIKGVRITGVRLDRSEKEGVRVYIDGVAGGALGDTMSMVEKLRTAMAMRGYQADGGSNMARGSRSGIFQVVLKWTGGDADEI